MHLPRLRGDLPLRPAVQQVNLPVPLRQDQTVLQCDRLPLSDGLYLVDVLSNTLARQEEVLAGLHGRYETTAIPVDPVLRSVWGDQNQSIEVKESVDLAGEVGQARGQRLDEPGRL